MESQMNEHSFSSPTQFPAANLNNLFHAKARALAEEGVSVPGYDSAKVATTSMRYKYGKRVFDVVCSAALILMLAPTLIAIYCCIKLTSPGPVLYKEKRIGRWGIHFTIFKFRTMHTKEYLEQKNINLSAEQLEFLRTHGKGTYDPRITPVGATLRKWSLDELPQLFNVLFGSMSLVGPRPVASSAASMISWFQVFRVSGKSQAAAMLVLRSASSLTRNTPSFGPS